LIVERNDLKPWTAFELFDNYPGPGEC